MMQPSALLALLPPLLLLPLHAACTPLPDSRCASPVLEMGVSVLEGAPQNGARAVGPRLGVARQAHVRETKGVGGVPGTGASDDRPGRDGGLQAHLARGRDAAAFDENVCTSGW